MSILFLAIWQTFESENNKSSMKLVDERLSLIEEQINIVDETNNDSMTDITSSIQFLDKEIRKLWDLSNKRNKVDIQKLTEQTNEIENLLLTIRNDIEINQKNLLSTQDSVSKNIKKIDDLGLSSEDLISLKLSLNNIDTQLILLDDSVQALNNYRNQLNQVILEIQTQISSVQNSLNSDKVVQN
jgi:prefoldin subunit 5